MLGKEANKALQGAKEELAKLVFQNHSAIRALEIAAQKGSCGEELEEEEEELDGALCRELMSQFGRAKRAPPFQRVDPQARKQALRRGLKGPALVAPGNVRKALRALLERACAQPSLYRLARRSRDEPRGLEEIVEAGVRARMGARPRPLRFALSASSQARKQALPRAPAFFVSRASALGSAERLSAPPVSTGSPNLVLILAGGCDFLQIFGASSLGSF